MIKLVIIMPRIIITIINHDSCHFIISFYISLELVHFHVSINQENVSLYTGFI